MNHYPITHDNGTTDKRFRVSMEYTGHQSGKPRFVARFCDEYIGDYGSLPHCVLGMVVFNAKRKGGPVFENQPVD